MSAHVPDDDLQDPPEREGRDAQEQRDAQEGLDAQEGGDAEEGRDAQERREVNGVDEVSLVDPPSWARLLLVAAPFLLGGLVLVLLRLLDG